MQSKALLLLCVILFGHFASVLSALSAAAAPEWSHTCGGTRDDAPLSVIRTSDGGYAIAGSTESYGAGGFDFWLVKTDSSGNMQWSKTYGGALWDEANSVIQTSDGGYAMAGETKSYGAGGWDFWLVKTDSFGNKQWNQTYGGTDDDGAHSVVQTSDGGYAIAGSTWSYGAGYGDFWLVKADSSGNMQWSKAYGGPGDDKLLSMIRTSDGGYAMAGYTESFGAGGFDFWLVKTDSSGNMQWNKAYGGSSYDGAYSVIQTSDGGYAMAGYTMSYGAGLGDFWLVKTDSSGNKQWSKTYGGTDDEAAYSVIQTSDGGYAMAGETASYGAGNPDFWLVKVDSSGNTQWSQTYGGQGLDAAWSVIQTNDGGYVIAGDTNSYGAGGLDFLLVKTDEQGRSSQTPSPMPSQPITISLERFYYNDSLPTQLDEFLKEEAVEDIAIFGKFHAVLSPAGSIQNAEAKVTVDYVKPGDAIIFHEEQLFPLTASGNEFVGDIKLETVWPYQGVEWLQAFTMARIFSDPSYIYEHLGTDIYLPEYRIYIGFEKIYTGATVTGVLGTDTQGKTFDLPFQTPLSLKSSYQKIADWAKGSESLFVSTNCPVSLSIKDSSGNRVGIYQNTSYEQIQNAYYVGEQGKVQLVVIENPSGRYNIEVEGAAAGQYTLVAGRNIAGKRETWILADTKPIQQGSVEQYLVSTIPSEPISTVGRPLFQSPDYTVYAAAGLTGAALIIAALVGIMFRKRRKRFQNELSARRASKETELEGA